MLEFKEIYEASNLKSNQMVLDIETTGLDSKKDKLVLLGLVYHENDRFYIHQLFAQNNGEELILLKKFLELSRSKQLIHYNGDNFDLRFLEKRCLVHNLNFYYPTLSIDILKIIKSYDKFFNFSSYRLNDVEYLVDFHRKEIRYKNISKITENYKKRSNYAPIINHNKNDLIATERLLNIRKILDNKLSLKTEKGDILTLKEVKIEKNNAEILLESSKKKKHSIFHDEDYVLIIKSNQITILIDIYKGRIDSDTLGYVMLNSLNIPVHDDILNDKRLMVIKKDRQFCYKNILCLCDFILSNKNVDL